MSLIAFEFIYTHQAGSGVRTLYIQSRIGTNIVGSLKKSKVLCLGLEILKCTDIETKKRKEQKKDLTFSKKENGCYMSLTSSSKQKFKAHRLKDTIAIKI